MLGEKVVGQTGGRRGTGDGIDVVSLRTIENWKQA